MYSTFHLTLRYKVHSSNLAPSLCCIFSLFSVYSFHIALYLQIILNSSPVLYVTAALLTCFIYLFIYFSLCVPSFMPCFHVYVMLCHSSKCFFLTVFILLFSVCCFLLSCCIFFPPTYTMVFFFSFIVIFLSSYYTHFPHYHNASSSHTVHFRPSLTPSPSLLSLTNPSHLFLLPLVTQPLPPLPPFFSADLPFFLQPLPLPPSYLKFTPSSLPLSR